MAALLDGIIIVPQAVKLAIIEAVNELSRQLITLDAAEAIRVPRDICHITEYSQSPFDNQLLTAITIL